MIDCKYHANGHCMLAEAAAMRITGTRLDCTPTEGACNHCLKTTPDPKRDAYGEVVCSLISAALRNNGGDHMTALLATCRSELVVEPPSLPRGVGTNLKERWQSYGMPSCQFCRNLAEDMNRWGPVGCRVRFDEIVNRILTHARKWTKEVEQETGEKVHFLHRVLIKSPNFLKKLKIESDVEWAIAVEEDRVEKKE